MYYSTCVGIYTLHTTVYICVHTYIYTYTHYSTFMYVCVYKYVYIPVYIHIDTNRPSKRFVQGS